RRSLPDATLTRQDSWHERRPLDPPRQYVLPPRADRSRKRRSCHSQSDLPANVVPQRPVDASAFHAALVAKRRTRPADLSSLSTHAPHLWLWRFHVPRHPLERPRWLHLVDPWS